MSSRLLSAFWMIASEIPKKERMLLDDSRTIPQVTLNEEIVVGSRLSLSVTLEGIIPIKIPCLDIGGTNLGSWWVHDSSVS